MILAFKKFSTNFKKTQKLQYYFGRHHQILGVPDNATPKEIREAYIRLSKLYHPDVNIDENSLEKFKIIGLSYNELIKEFSKESLNEGKINSNTATSESSQNQNESIYQEIFKKSYSEDPMAFYDPNNIEKRREYERRTHKSQSPPNVSQEFNENVNSNWEQTLNYQNERLISNSDSLQYKYSRMNLLIGICGFALTFVGISYFAFRDTLIMNIHKLVKDGTHDNDEDYRTQITIDTLRNNKSQKKEEFYEKTGTMYQFDFRSSIPVENKLIYYSIFPDIKLFEVKPKYFYMNDEELQKLKGKEIEKHLLFNAKPKTLLSLSIEAERILKRIQVKSSDLKAEIAEKGYYETPFIMFRFMGFIGFKPKKIIIPKEVIDNITKPELISLHKLLINYSSPIPYAFYKNFDIPQSGSEKVGGRLESVTSSFIGDININHREISERILERNEKVLKIFRSKKNIDDAYYLKNWDSFYSKFTIK